MTIARSFLRLIVVAMAILVLGLGAGCNNQTEIPLAKVPPPPPGFGEVKKSPNAPKGASPENTSQYYK